MLQFLRKLRVSFNGGALIVNPGGLDQPQLKVEIDIAKGISGSANTARVSIWNLKEAHRNAVGKEWDDVKVEAGYIPPGSGEGNVGIIFSGQMRDVEHKREKGDIITTISCGDADKAFRRATISKTFLPGTPVKDVVEELYKNLEKEGVKRGEWKFPENMPPYRRPYSICGSCTRELDVVGRSRGFYWNVQNGVMEVIPSDGYVGGMVILSQDTGLVGVPTITDNGVRAKALLNPEIRPNRRVQIKSKILEMNGEGGVYRVSQANFTGNNMDGEFLVEITGEAIKGGKVDEGKKP